MKRFFIPLAALFSLVAPELTRAAPPIYPGVVPYEQLDTRNFYLGNYPILRIMPFMPKDTPPYLPVDTWSFAVNTNLWTLYAYDPPNTTWHQVLGLGGIAVTINPTDTVMPYRVDATTFGDSPWSVPGAGQAYADGANAFLHLDLATGNSAYHTTTPNSTLAIYPQMLMEQVPSMGDTVSTTTMAEGMLVSNPTPSTAAAPENSPSMYWGGSAWSTNGAASTPMAFAAVGVPRNAANIPTAYWSLFSSVSNRPPTLEFTVKEGSGYTGLGTSYLSDAGTYTSNLTTWSTYLMYSTITNLITYNLSIVQGGVTNTVGSMNPTDGYVPYRLNSTNFADSPWYRAAADRMGFAGTTPFIYGSAGSRNTALGYNAQSGTGNAVSTSVGYNAMPGSNNQNNDAFGAYALYRTEGGADSCVSIGGYSLYSFTNGIGNTAVGYTSMYYLTNGNYNTALGFRALDPLSSGDYNVAIGPTTLFNEKHGGENVAVGYNALRNQNGQGGNTALGAFAGQNIAAQTNVIVIGHGSTVTNDNDIVIGNSTNSRVIFPIASWGGTGSKVLTDNGTYQTASSVITGAISSQLLWTNSPTGGGSLTASSNVIASLPTGLYGSVFNNSEDIFAAGENAGQGEAVLQSTNLYNIGLLSGYGMTGNEAWMVMNIGDAAGRGATIYNSQDVYNFGIAPGELSQITNGSWVVMNIGDNAGYAMVTDKSQDIFNYGWLSGDSMGVSNSIAIFNYGDWAGRNNISVIQNSQEIYNYGYAAGVDQNPRNSTNLYNYGNIAGGVQQAIEVNGYYNYGTDSGWMGVGLASNSEELYNYGAWAGASLAALVADGTFVNFTNVYNYGPEAGMQIKGTNATYVLNYGYRAGEQSTMTGVSDLYNYGSDSGFQSTYDTSATDIYNYGTSAGKGASYTNSFFILNSGNSAGQSMVSQDSSSILNLGSYAGADSILTNSSSVVNIGPYSGNLENVTNSTYIFSYGDRAGNLLIANNSSADIFNYGHDAGKSMVADGSYEIYNFGNGPGHRQKVYSGSTDIYNFGYFPGEDQIITNTSTYVFGYGNFAGGGSVFDAVANVFNYGNVSGENSVFISSQNLFNYGDAAGDSMFATNSSADIFNYGHDAGKSMTADGSTDIYAYGYQALYQAQLTNSSQVYAYGNQAGASLAGDGYTNIYLFAAASPTRKTNEFVFGSANYLVTVPGQLSVSGPLTNYIAGYTGIGTNTPSEKFEVLGVAKAVGNLQNGKIRVQTYGTNVQSYLALDFARGSMANPLAVQTGDTIGQVVAVGHDGSVWGHGADMRFLAAQDWTGSTYASTLQLWAVPYNSTTEGLAFSVLPVYGSANFASTASYAYSAGATTTAHALINGLNDAGTGVALDFISAANLSYPCGRIDVTRPSSATASRMTFSVINPSSPFQLLPAITIETNRNVGIGTNAPSEKLEVLGNIKASGKALLKGGVQDGYTNVLTSTTAKDFFYVAVPNTNGIGGHVVYTVFATDGTDVQEISGDVKFAAVAKSTTVTASTADVQAPAVVTGGSTLTAALAANVATNNVFALGVTATTSLTTTNLVIKWRVETPSTFTVNAIP